MFKVHQIRLSVYLSSKFFMHFDPKLKNRKKLIAELERFR